MGISRRKHAIMVPFPAQGHINPMLQLAKLLHSKYGFYITFLNTVYNHNRFLDSHGPLSLHGLPGFRFESIPDELPHPATGAGPGARAATQDIAALCRSTTTTCLDPFRDLIKRLNDDRNGPPVTYIVADGVMSFTMKAAQEFGIPEVVFWTTSACGYMAYAHFRTLIEKGLIPLQDASYLTNGYLETPVNFLPGMKNIRLKDLPSFIRTTDPDDFMLNFNLNQVEATSKASSIIFNTFESFEHEVLNALSLMKNLPPIYPIGPLELLLDQIPVEDPIKSIGSSLWKENSSCINWLDSKEPDSVVYINFGSITVVTPSQLTEFAWGLANSKKSFLWVLRPDLIEKWVPPEEFVTETKGSGMLAKWVPQKEVLKHKSIGGFLTHCGWNSLLESICGGKPMICWPFFAEQQMNCRYSCVEWEMGLEIECDVNRGDVEILVRVLMEEEEGKGKEMKRKAMYWMSEAQETAKPGGCSHMNLDKVVTELLGLKN